MNDNEQLQNFITELRRGSLTLAVLGCLKCPHYGYALLQTIQEKGIDIEANTLYPLLRRLEGQELLNSQWDTTEARPRKYYSVSPKGEALYKELGREWQSIQLRIDRICEEEKQNG